MKTFERDGLRMFYPEGWSVDVDPAESGWTATFQSPGTAFLVLRVDGALPTSEDVADAVLEALRAEYKDIDSTSALETIAGEVAVGYDIDFVSLDVPTQCAVRSFYGPAGTVLVLGQVSDLDADPYADVLAAMRASIGVEE